MKKYIKNIQISKMHAFYSVFMVLSQAVHEDTVRLSMGTVIQQGPRIAERQFL